MATESKQSKLPVRRYQLTDLGTAESNLVSSHVKDAHKTNNQNNVSDETHVPFNIYGEPLKNVNMTYQKQWIG